MVRDAVAEDEIGGFRIPARSMIILSPYVTHRHPGIWPDPEVFDPDRFTPDRSRAGLASPGSPFWAVRISASARNSR